MGEFFTRPDTKAFLDMLAAMPGGDWPPQPAVYRAQYLGMKDLVDLPTGDMAVIRDVEIPGPAGPLAARLYDTRETRAPGPLVLFFHGGGFVIGDIDSHASFTAEMSRQLDLPVLSIDYRRAPESPWPAASDDCEAAARWVASNPSALGRSVTSIAVAGDSAGGQLAAVVALDLRDASAQVPVVAQLLIYPAVDMAGDYPSLHDFADGYFLTLRGIEWFNACYAPDFDHPRASPLRSADLTALPPALIITASLDPIRDQGRSYAAKLIAAGVPVVFREAVGNIHGFINMRRAIPSSQGDVAAMLGAFRTLLNEAEADPVMIQATP